MGGGGAAVAVAIAVAVAEGLAIAVGVSVGDGGRGDGAAVRVGEGVGNACAGVAGCGASAAMVLIDGAGAIGVRAGARVSATAAGWVARSMAVRAAGAAGRAVGCARQPLLSPAAARSAMTMAIPLGTSDMAPAFHSLPWVVHGVHIGPDGQWPVNAAWRGRGASSMPAGGCFQRRRDIIDRRRGGDGGAAARRPCQSGTRPGDVAHHSASAGACCRGWLCPLTVPGSRARSHAWPRPELH